MPKQISQNDLESIVKVVGIFPSGAGIEEIYSTLEGRVPRRTLQRRLALLVEQKSLIKEGRARASRYRLTVITGEANLRAEPDIFVARGEVYIPLSPDGEESKKAIRKPIQGRQPVGYNRTFLDSYRPNSTFYLTIETRQRLAGRSETDISPSDQSRIIEVVETELSNLYEGNFARYGLRPMEFADWKKVWR